MRLKIAFVFCLLTTTMGELFAQNSDNIPKPVIVDYINTFKDIAISEMKRTGVPAAITLAQGIHETEAGTSVLVRKSNNHFGIKCKSGWTGDRVSHDDDAKGECFRSYSSPQDSYMDHSDFLKNSPRYASLFALDPWDYEGWAFGLRKAGYATNPKYASILIRIIKEYHLQDYTLIALEKMKPEDEWLATVAMANKSLTSPDDAAVLESTSETAQKIEKPIIDYPSGEFKINATRVVYAKAGSSLLALADEYNVSLKRLIDFNELSLQNEDVLQQSQLIYLQRKRKVGSNEFHIVAEGETLYDICQAEGLRLANLLEYNQLENGMLPAAGEKLYLKTFSPARPLLESEVRKPITNALFSNNYTLHIVQTKETLYAISRKYNVPVEKLKEWNNLVTYDLKKGQELIIYKN